MLSVKQGDNKYHFLSLWYDSTWDWTLVYWAITKHSNHLANEPVNIVVILNKNKSFLSIYDGCTYNYNSQSGTFKTKFYIFDKIYTIEL